MTHPISHDYKVLTFDQSIQAIKEGLQNLQEIDMMNESYIKILKAENERFREALEMIKDKSPRCDCMDAHGIAAKALVYVYVDA